MNRPRQPEETGPAGHRRGESPLKGYPWALEREAVEALENLEVDRCRGVLQRLGEGVRVLPGAPMGVIALLLNDLLGRLRIGLHPDAGGSEEAGYHGSDDWQSSPRLRRAQRLGACGDLASLRAAFLHEVDELFAPLASSAGLSPGVLRARAFLGRHFTRRVSLRELAEAVHLSPNYLSSIFRRETGMTVTEYLREQRTRRAQQLLLEGKHTISEVAYLVGFQNYRDFHRNFVRAGGRSPRAFQRLCRSRRTSLRDGASSLHAME